MFKVRERNCIHALFIDAKHLMLAISVGEIKTVENIPLFQKVQVKSNG